MSPVTDLVEFTLSYGECAGYCTTTLQVDGRRLELIRTNTDPSELALRFTGVLEDEMALRLSGAMERIEPARLELVHGSPDARDEGAATMRFRDDATVTEHRYSATDPPPELGELHDLLSTIVLAWLEGDSVPGAFFDSTPDT